MMGGAYATEYWIWAVIDFLVRMIDKYGEEVLRELEEEKQNKQEKEAAVFWNTKCKSDCRFFVKLFGCVIFYFCKHIRTVFTFTLKYNII